MSTSVLLPYEIQRKIIYRLFISWALSMNWQIKNFYKNKDSINRIFFSSYMNYLYYAKLNCLYNFILAIQIFYKKCSIWKSSSLFSCNKILKSSTGTQEFIKAFINFQCFLLINLLTIIFKGIIQDSTIILDLNY